MKTESKNNVTDDTKRIKPLSKYVCTERIFNSSLFICKKIFMKKTVIE